MSYAQYYAGIAWEENLNASAILSLWLFVASIMTAYWFQYYLPQKNRYGWVLLVSLITTFIGIYAAHELVRLAGIRSQVWLDYIQSMRVWFLAFLTSNQLIVSIVIVGWIRKEEQALNESKIIEAEKLNKEAQLFLLHQQLQPHFMFNSLNSISALIGKRPTEAREMLMQLSSFLRGTINSDSKPLVPLREELVIMSHYLAIEKVRFSHRLLVDYQLNEGVEELLLPPLILQPLIENAIKYGLKSDSESVYIGISAQLINSELVIIITNPIDESIISEGTGFGLQGIKRRLYLLYLRNNLLQTSVSTHTFTVSLSIPQYTA